MTVYQRPSINDLVGSGKDWHGRWGRLDTTLVEVSPTVAVRKVRLSIYPPGTNRIEAMLQSVHRLGGNRTGGGAVVLVTLIVLLATRSLWACGVTIGVLAILWVVASHRGAKVRRRIHTVEATVSTSGTGGHQPLETIALQLDALDSLDVDPVTYELRWGQIYEQAAGD